jgi:hypothetical protein
MFVEFSNYRLSENEQIRGGKVRIMLPRTDLTEGASKRVLGTSGHRSDSECQLQSHTKHLLDEEECSGSDSDNGLASYSEISGHMESVVEKASRKQASFADQTQRPKKKEFEKRGFQASSSQKSDSVPLGTHATYLMHRELRDVESRLNIKVYFGKESSCTVVVACVLRKKTIVPHCLRIFVCKNTPVCCVIH